MSGNNYQVVKLRRGVPHSVREYDKLGKAKKYVDRLNRALLMDRGAPLCRAFLLMQDGKLLRGPSAVLRLSFILRSI